MRVSVNHVGLFPFRVTRRPTPTIPSDAASVSTWTEYLYAIPRQFPERHRYRLDR